MPTTTAVPLESVYKCPRARALYNESDTAFGPLWRVGDFGRKEEHIALSQLLCNWSSVYDKRKHSFTGELIENLFKWIDVVVAMKVRTNRYDRHQIRVLPDDLIRECLPSRLAVCRQPPH
jgi:hypothetical protein